jgi:hypothetical protein
VRWAAILLVTGLGAGGCRADHSEPVRADASSGEDAALDGSLGDAKAQQEVPDAATADGGARPTPARWAMWPIPNSPSSGLPNPQSYDSSVSGGVLDRVTGLMWQRRVGPDTMTFDAANARCDDLELGGHRDWRLPSRIELVSILDLAETQPSIDRDAFPRTPSDWFWTSSPASDNPAEAWYVYFYFGYPKTDERRSRFSVRCVRTERPPVFTGDPDSHYDASPARVRDLATGLSWERVPPARTLAFEAALAYCAHLNLDGHKDWRLPSMPELVSLVDERASNPAIDGAAFPGTPADSFWTSSLFGGPRSTEAWHVRFDHGSALYGLFKSSYNVRCVR